MNKLIGVTLLLLVSAAARADIAVEAEDGHVFWSGECASGYKFSYFDGNRIQRACIEPTETVTVQRMVALSRDFDCFGQVRVDSGTIREGRLYANEITKVWGCHDGKQEFL